MISSVANNTLGILISDNQCLFSNVLVGSQSGGIYLLLLLSL